MFSNRSRKTGSGAACALAAALVLFGIVYALAGFPSAAHAVDGAASGTHLTTAAAASSSAKTADAKVADGVYVIGSATKRNAVLDIAGASTGNDALLQAWRANWTPAQRWRISRLADGFYKIESVCSGKALGIAGTKVGNGTPVRQSTWKGRKAQKWRILKDGAGYRLVSALSSKHSLCFAKGGTADGTPARMETDKAGRADKAKRMRLSPVKPLVVDGMYRLTCVGSGKVLDVAGGGVASGSNIQQRAKASKNGALGQVFRLTYDADTGYYRVTGAASGLSLDVDGADGADGANVRLRAANDGAAQKWALAQDADGAFALHSATSGRVLDVAGGSKANGANVQIYAPNGTDAQKWRLSAVSRWLPDGTYTFASSLNTANMMAVAGASKSKGANVKTAPRANAGTQKWIVEYDKKVRAYTIRNKRSGLMLEAAGTGDGANVRQAKATGKKSQLWIPQLSVGGIRFLSAANSKAALGVADASKKAGANVALTTRTARTAAKFRLRDASLPLFKVYLNPGHGWNSYGNGAWDSGAQGNGYSEADFTHDLARRVQDRCESYGIEIVNGEQFQLAYWDRMPKAVSLGCDVIVSIHFDWSGAGVSGTHTMVGVQGKAKGSDLLNDIIHRHLVAATGLSDLGTFSRSDITAVNGAIPSMLMEVCFMDSYHDVSTYLSRRDRIAKAIADGILEASQQPSLCG